MVSPSILMPFWDEEGYVSYCSSPAVLGSIISLSLNIGSSITHVIFHALLCVVGLAAVKCNPDPYVLRLLAALGTGFDCASHGEIKQVLDLELPVDPSKIIFANPCKSISFIRSAAKMGVHTMTFDNTDELYKIARNNRQAKLVVRILTDDSKSLCRLGLKFGAPLDAVPHLLETAGALGLDVVGVSFHVGSGNYDPGAFSDAIQRAKKAFEMGWARGFNFTLLDVGGGFESGHFEATAKNLREALDVWFPKSMRQARCIKVIAEPGRYFVSDAFQLSANIIARRLGAKDEEVVEEAGVMDMDLEDVPASPATAVAEETVVNSDAIDEGEQPKVMCKSGFYVGVYVCSSDLVSFRLHQRRRIRCLQLHHVRPSKSDPLPFDCGPLPRYLRQRLRSAAYYACERLGSHL